MFQSGTAWLGVRVAAQSYTLLDTHTHAGIYSSRVLPGNTVSEWQEGEGRQQLLLAESLLLREESESAVSVLASCWDRLLLAV